MKATFAKTNPAFKRAQALPLIGEVRAPFAACAARRFADSILPQKNPAPCAVDVVACTVSAIPDSITQRSAP